MVVYLRKNIRALFSVFKKKGPKGKDEQKRLTVHYTASQHYQENVFIEGSRPQYLEALHTEAREGLKIQQQEEHMNGAEVQDDQSIASTSTLQTMSESSGPKDRDGSPETGSTNGNSVAAATSSAPAAASDRPVLTRQGSTFKPLNPVKRFDKNRRRSRRTTITGIPQQVQRELALHRGSMYQQGASSQLPNGGKLGSEGVVVIPTIDGETAVGSPEGARVNLLDLETSREEQLLRHHLQVVYKDEQDFSHHRLGSRLSPVSSKRPKSLAVPGMTSPSSTSFHFLHEPYGPVMSISPQATYLSKIIPNAILPASIDVIQIDRSNIQNRGNSINHGGCGRAVSRSSLGSGGSSASPASSRRLGGEGSNTDSFHSNPTAAQPAASGSNCNQSQSSDTIISNSSTISSKGSPGESEPQIKTRVREGGPSKMTAGDQDLVSLQSSASWVSGTSSIGGSGHGSEHGISGSASAGENLGGDSVRNSRSFTRSLSIMKTKLPPAPPRRTNSLHHDTVMKSRFGELADVKDLSDSLSGEVEAGTHSPVREENRVASDKSQCPALVSESPDSRSLEESRSSASSGLSPTQTSPGAGEAPDPQAVSSNSSPQNTPCEGGKFERTMSPSSGYSSQSGTPTLSPKGICPTSPCPGKQKKKPVKPERSASRASSAASASSSLTSLSSSTSEPVNHETQANSPSPPQRESPPPVAMTTKKAALSNQAPSPGTAVIRELFNVPPPPKVKAPSPPPPETWAHNRRTFELLCGPCPNATRLAQLQTQHQLKETKTKAMTQTEVSNKSQSPPAEQHLVEEAVLPSSEKAELQLVKDPERISQESKSAECLSTEQRSRSVSEKDEAREVIQRQEDCSGPVKESERLECLAVAKKEPPPVMKKSTQMLLRKEHVKSAECQQQKQVDDVTTTVIVQSPAGNGSASTPKVDADCKCKEGEVNTKSTQENPPVSRLTMSVDPPKTDKISPPPSPPPAHHPPPPPLKKTPPSSVSSLPSEEVVVEEEGVSMMETSWPPPPPPLDAVFDGPEEMDFPPPPPPFTTECLPDVVESCSTLLTVPNDPTQAIEEVGATMNGECANVSSIAVQIGMEQFRPEVAGQSKTTTIIYEVPELEHQLTSPGSPIVDSILNNEREEGVTKEPMTNQEETDLLINTCHLQHFPPPPPLEAPYPPPTISVKESSGSYPLVPPLSIPLPPPIPFEDQPPSHPPVSAPCPPPINVLSPPPLPAENQSAPGVTFRRQPSLMNREAKNKELLSRHKISPIPKEDANIPLVTPSLLQMVRLRSVNVGEEQANIQSEGSSTNGSSQEQSLTSTPGTQIMPQKPIRKSLSLKSPHPSLKSPSVTLNAPSTRLQEAIRMKTAAMSSRNGLPSRLRMHSSTSSTTSSSSAGEPGVQSLKSPEGGGDLHKSPASTASFIFSRSATKVIIETPTASTPETQANLRQSLAAELMQVSEQASAPVSNGVGQKSQLLRKPGKVPPPVARKPAPGTTNMQEMPAGSEGEVKMAAEATRSTDVVQPASQLVSPNQQTECNAEASDC
ncbi:uncharacterized protein KIAA1522 homolog isoform X2 [Hypomesus transpacificus]|uniref:uncharacterized protein KIAA1522 homolog isoform X2 n=1 Tax=Hypomesus transpacificus TaxID=137520 RepID=UPI001F07C193|nr:uncharacterized protein KIAA1522 homolog isoform X2 [Hypomesus transpacificus]